jgi:hypothetical protein
MEIAGITKNPSFLVEGDQELAALLGGAPPKTC